jgi:phosphoglycolate phosphatase-like HAD superfamily hydrolase
MTWLVLFDVDGTLLLTHDEVYVEASRLAMEAVFGTSADGPDVPGDTATAHIRRALRAAGVAEPEIDEGLPRWCEIFSDTYLRLLDAADTSHWQPGRHAAEAVAALERRALLTGNPPAVAHARMERLGLGPLFPRGQGAFGCEREDRVELFDLARERAGGWPSRHTVAVGDTPLDVSSAHAAGCRSVAVTTGNYDAEALADADAVIGDLGDLGAALASLADPGRPVDRPSH